MSDETLTPASERATEHARSPIRLGVSLGRQAPAGGGSGARSSVVLAVGDFCQALRAIVGVEVTADVYPDYLALLEGINQGHADLVWLPPVVALRSVSRGSTVPVALPVRNGLSWFSAALFTRADSRIAGLDSLRGCTAAWVDPQSAAGYLVIRAWMRSQGYDPQALFAREHFLGSHEQVVQAVMRGAADVGATFAHLGEDTQWVRSAGWGTHAVRVLALAGPIPSDVLAASVRLPLPTIRHLREVFVHHASEELRRASRALLQADGFIAAEPEHMAPLVGLLNHLEDTARTCL